jgi:uncharacterized protein
MKIGVISDTHDYLDAKIPELFEGVDHILHAGDIGLPWIILQLEDIAPVTAVVGNNDPGLNFKETELVQLNGRKFMVHHIVDVRSPAPGVQRRIIRDNPDVVVFGHTHKPFNSRIGNTLFFNPGYAGRSRFGMPRSVAILHSENGDVRAEFKEF